ncbi:MAG: hypothetical protein FJ363_06175 [Gemmatimonadetes bacterium]|nr:hypothetical protein [Gemmatimonadota bacterium]
MRTVSFALAALGVLSACSLHVRRGAPAPSAAEGTIAQIYYWRAKPGKFDEYTRYVREHAEPIDEAGRRDGAFLSVTTFMTRDTTSAWTHMRVFVLRDSTQLGELSAKLSAAGARLEPDSVKRRLAGEYSATLRDAAGRATVAILR